MYILYTLYSEGYRGGIPRIVPTSKVYLYSPAKKKMRSFFAATSLRWGKPWFTSNDKSLQCYPQLNNSSHTFALCL